MAKRKTVRLAELVRWVNAKNAASVTGPEVRRGWNAMLESALMEADVYAGFRYLTGEEVPYGVDPGIIWLDRGAGVAVYPDETRRAYYLDKTLK